MGQLTNALFKGLMGWVQAVVSDLWQLITGGDTSAWLKWVLDNWLPLTLLLCAVGLVIDFLVYLIRWQPYRMWGGFLRSLFGRSSDEPVEEEVPDETQYQRRWVYADGTTTVEDIRRTPLEPDDPDEHLELPVRPVRRTAMHFDSEKSYYRPVYPPQWQRPAEEKDLGGSE